jgi:hypothetical protein
MRLRQRLSSRGVKVNKITNRIERSLGMPGLVTTLARRISPTDLQSLLLEVYRQRAAEKTPSDVLAQYERDRFVQPSPVSPALITRWDQIAYQTLPREFDAITISPLSPLGTSSVVASVDQNWAVSTSRNTEVDSDSTNALALECAVRRRRLLEVDPRSQSPVHLATAHRLVRAQHYQDPSMSSHFTAFVLCSAGRDQGHFEFETTSIKSQIRFFLQAIREYAAQDVPLIVTFTDYGRALSQDDLQGFLLNEIPEGIGGIECRMDNKASMGKSYYTGFKYHIDAVVDSGVEMELVEGGSVDWTQKYLSNAKERLVIGGLGVDRLAQHFG